VQAFFGDRFDSWPDPVARKRFATAFAMPGCSGSKVRAAGGGKMTTYTIHPSERKAAGITRPLRYAAALLGDLRVAIRSLGRTPTLWATVALTLALGIGVNAAIFSVVRGVLLRPLVNRDEDRLIYVLQSAPGLQVANASFSIPEITDIGTHLKTISNLGTFSTVDFTVQGVGEAREIHAGVVDGT